ncbi:MAG: HAD-IA family hydrolase [Actinobacteria bacterium]|nr:HAD-IA family hydrolase [Actinomycetota bacterium]
MSRGFEPVLFDLDGTVVDTVELIRRSFRYATQQVLGRELPDQEILAYVGQPLMRQMVQIAPDRAQELYDVYREYNHRIHDELIASYDGIETVLAALRDGGRRLGLVTSKSAETTAMAFRAVGLREHFDVVITASDTTAHKPSPEPLLLCLQRLATEDRPAVAARAVYVGDSPFDIAAGKAAGMATIAVTWGLFSRQDLLAAGPDYVVERPGDLVRLCLEGAVSCAGSRCR